MDDILHAFDMTPEIHVTKPAASGRKRREFRGDRTQITLQPELTYSWVSSFQKLSATIPQQCAYVFEKYERHVNRCAPGLT